MNESKKPFPSTEKNSQVGADLLSSVVVFLVALPLCMGVAIASGVPVAAGLFTGIIAGLVVGPFAGCPLQVSGPAAGLAVIVYDIVQRFGVERLGVVVLIAGVVQLVAGSLRLGQWFRAVSPAVIKGMLAGIGILIFVTQFHVMLDARPSGNVLDDIIGMPDRVIKAFTQNEFESADVREFRTTHLRQVQSLRRRQIEINKQVVSLLPLDAEQEPEELASDLKVQIESRPVEFKQLAVEQQRIADGLSQINQMIRDFEGSHKSEKSVTIINALNASTEQMAHATADLTGGELLAAVQSQALTIEAFDTYLGSLKSHGLAAQMGILTIAVIVFWPLLAPKRLAPIPGSLIAIVLACTISALFSLPIVYVDVPLNILDEINLPTWQLLREMPWVAAIQTGVALAVVASAETLLCATATDRLHPGPKTQYNKELFAQGLGNCACGLVGALPLAGVFVRSTANIDSGGRSRLSAILHGVWLLCL